MQSTIRALALLTLLFSVQGCGTEDLSAEDAIVQAREAIEAAWMSEDVNFIMSYYADDIILMPPNGERIVGTEENRGFLQGVFDNFNMTGLRATERDVIVSGAWAMEVGTEEWTLVPETGGEGVPERVDFIRIWRKQSPDTWKTVRVIWNSKYPVSGS